MAAVGDTCFDDDVRVVFWCGGSRVMKEMKGKAKTARAESKLDAGESKISDKWFRICQDGCKRTSICIVR